jgi:anti-anti-sigma factor
MSEGRILYAKEGSTYVLKYVGDIRYTICAPLNGFISELCSDEGFDNILIDLTEAESIDSTNPGLLARIANLMYDRFRRRTTIVPTNDNVNRTLEAVGFFDIFTVDAGTDMQVANMHTLSHSMTTEAEMADAILEAHRTLSKLNDTNREMFRNVVEVLEAELRSDI